ncbi:surfeit locus protein 6, partial [Rhinoderma darwinii]|uniref:surfeit locus protein 6 n=1 Tax=Rhinoderma darwinii TaxID=43563 RepID=UPI003F67F87D
GAQGTTQKPLLIFSTAQRTAPSLSSFSTVDLLRKRLHEKIEESRGQVSNKSVSTEEIERRRQRRKQERERKKRKRKELKMKDNPETPTVDTSSGEKLPEDLTKDTAQPPIVFNKVEVRDEPINKVMKKKEKKQSVKGNITPMTGKNYKQLLSRLDSRKSKLEELRAKDQEKAKEFENKIKWTNVLYKAEGLKIKDDEGMLKTALKRKEKQKEQRKSRWDHRIQNTAEKMQQRQDKRSRNIKKKKVAKLENKKNRARKRGRIMPEDVAKAKVK